jgi:tetratricopeptide (TPR) repeat protein
VDEGITADLLDPAVRSALRSLSIASEQKVVGHLVMAGRLLDDDPVLALRHARAARSVASRVGVVREAAGIAAYAAGEFAEARAELRAARRMTGVMDYLPLLADCERALGRPEQALEIAHGLEVAKLPPDVRVELMIVASGARRDLGQGEAAIAELSGRDLNDDTVRPWTGRLWYAYAEALLVAGRTDEAATWFGSVSSIDEDEETDAAERYAALTGEETDAEEPPAGD